MIHINYFLESLVFFIFRLLPFVILLLVLYPFYVKLKYKMVSKLIYSREFSETGVFEGDEVYFIETIYNNSFMPLFYIEIESYIYKNLKLLNADYKFNSDSPMQLIISRFHLLPFMKIERRHKIKCLRRGYYKLETVCIYVKKREIFLYPEAVLYVYPKIFDLDYESYPVNFVNGAYMSMRRIIQDPFSVSGIRDYMMGDPFNLINFKATAKNAGRGIKVNKLDFSANRAVMICINFQAPADYDIKIRKYEYLMENAISYTASFAYEALRKGYKIGIYANCRMADGAKALYFPLLGGMYHIEEIFKETAKMQISSDMSFNSVLKRCLNDNLHDSEVFLFTLYIDGETDGYIRALRRSNNAVNVILIGGIAGGDFYEAV